MCSKYVRYQLMTVHLLITSKHDIFFSLFYIGI